MSTAKFRNDLAINGQLALNDTDSRSYNNSVMGVQTSESDVYITAENDIVLMFNINENNNNNSFFVRNDGDNSTNLFEVDHLGVATCVSLVAPSSVTTSQLQSTAQLSIYSQAYMKLASNSYISFEADGDFVFSTNTGDVEKARLSMPEGDLSIVGELTTGAGFVGAKYNDGGRAIFCHKDYSGGNEYGYSQYSDGSLLSSAAVGTSIGWGFGGTALLYLINSSGVEPVSPTPSLNIGGRVNAGNASMGGKYNFFNTAIFGHIDYSESNSYGYGQLTDGGLVMSAAIGESIVLGFNTGVSFELTSASAAFNTGVLVTADSFNGAVIKDDGVATEYLNGTGAYSTPDDGNDTLLASDNTWTGDNTYSQDDGTSVVLTLNPFTTGFPVESRLVFSSNGTVSYTLRESSGGLSFLGGSSESIDTMTMLSSGNVDFGYDVQIGLLTGANSKKLTISAGSAGTTESTINIGTQTREWEMVSGLSSDLYTLQFNYVGDDAPLDKAVVFEVDGNIEATSFNSVALTDGGAATNYLDETGNYSVPAGGVGDMEASTYDPAGVSEQLVGLTAAQSLSNKTFTSELILHAGIDSDNANWSINRNNVSMVTFYGSGANFDTSIGISGNVVATGNFTANSTGYFQTGSGGIFKTGSAVDLLLQRNSVTKLTLGDTQVDIPSGIVLTGVTNTWYFGIRDLATNEITKNINSVLRAFKIVSINDCTIGIGTSAVDLSVGDTVAIADSFYVKHTTIVDNLSSASVEVEEYVQ